MTDQPQPSPQNDPQPPPQTGQQQNYPYPPQGIPGQPGPIPTQPVGAAAPPARKGTLGLVALIIAIVGFLFAVVPGAMFIGWLLLPVAFILSLVTFFVKDQKKPLAIAALIVSVVGTIVGMIATMVMVGNAITDATGGTASVAPRDPATTQTAGAASGSGASTEASTAAAGAGTRQDPYPLGETIANDEWSVTVNSFTADATQQILTENEFNDEPPAGQTYALVNVTLTRVGADAQTPLFVSVSYVSNTGNTYDSTDNIVVPPEPIDSNELYEGGSVTGNIVIQIPEGDEGVLAITPGLLASDFFVATS